MMLVDESFFKDINSFLPVLHKQATVIVSPTPCQAAMAAAAAATLVMAVARGGSSNGYGGMHCTLISVRLWNFKDGGS